MLRPIVCSVSIGLAAVLPAAANIDPELHQLCVDARDYAGCVEMQQRPVAPGEPARLNACPAGHAYSGAGYCTRVICQSPRGGVFTRIILSSDGHDPDLAGKGNKCPRTGLISRTGSLRWGTDTVPAAHDPDCPNVNLDVGWQNSCMLSSNRVTPAATSHP